MMLRVIPRLDIKGPNLVKGIHLEGLRVLGRPEDFALKYYEEGADELLYMDVVASLYGRNSLLDFISKTAEKTFIPLTLGGGIRTIEDIRKVLRAGADKIAINTAAINNPSFISDAANMFGSQCIVVSIEAKKMSDGNYEALTDNGREVTGKDAFLWAEEAVKRGAGELLITSIDREGTAKGYDIELISKINRRVKVPVIALGGAGSPEHVCELLTQCCVSAVSMASLFHYHYLNMIDLSNKAGEEGNREFINKKRESGFMLGRLLPSSILNIKSILKNRERNFFIRDTL